MKRLSLSDLKAKQAELARKIAAAEEKERSLIGAYMQELTGECELAGVKSWLKEHAIMDNEVKEEKKNDGNGQLHRETAMAL